MQPLWLSNHPRLGICSTNANTNYAYLPITRCGSFFLLDMLYKNYNWDIEDYAQAVRLDPNYIPPNKTILCVIREPYERYISGVWECVDDNYQLLKSRDFVDRLVANPNIDLHTTLQTEYIDFYKNYDIIYFKFDEFLLDNIVNYLTKVANLRMPENTNNFVQKSIPKYDVLDMIEHFSLQETIKNYLQPDYCLYNNVKFYEAN